jgi:hypothetical protein
MFSLNMSNNHNVTYNAEVIDPENLLNQYVPSENVIKVFSRARTIKFLSLFHGLINVFYAFSRFWFYALFATLCFLGYKGAKEYKYNYTIFYMVYNIMDIIGQGILIYYVTLNKDDYQIDDNQLATYYAIQSFLFIINFWILCIVYNFIKDLKSISNDDLVFLRGGFPNLQNIQFVLI